MASFQERLARMRDEKVAAEEKKSREATERLDRELACWKETEEKKRKEVEERTGKETAFAQTHLRPIIEQVQEIYFGGRGDALDSVTDYSLVWDKHPREGTERRIELFCRLNDTAVMNICVICGNEETLFDSSNEDWIEKIEDFITEAILKDRVFRKIPPDIRYPDDNPWSGMQ